LPSAFGRWGLFGFGGTRANARSSCCIWRGNRRLAAEHVNNMPCVNLEKTGRDQTFFSGLRPEINRRKVFLSQLTKFLFRRFCGFDDFLAVRGALPFELRLFDERARELARPTSRGQSNPLRPGRRSADSVESPRAQEPVFSPVIFAERAKKGAGCGGGTIDTTPSVVVAGN